MGTFAAGSEICTSIFVSMSIVHLAVLPYRRGGGGAQVDVVGVQVAAHAHGAHAARRRAEL